LIEKWAKQLGIALDTGGYTGDWNGAGRFALLHQKELILNANDTKNILSAVSAVRDMSGLNGMVGNSISALLEKIGLGDIPKFKGSINNANEENETNVFNINAEFPNANDVNEIREALLSLPRLATQYISNNKK
jgi:hypothetical protein